MPSLGKESGPEEATTVTLGIPGWPSTDPWAPVAAFLAAWALPEAWPEMDDGAAVTPQAIETATCGLPWKAASDSSCQFAGRLGWLLVTGLRALEREVVTLRSKVRESEKEIRAFQDAEAILREVITTQAEQCHRLQGTVECLVAHVANKQRDRCRKSKVLISQVRALITKPLWDPKEWDGNIWSEFSDSEVEFDLALEGREVVGAQPPVQRKRQQEQAGEGVQIMCTYSLKELREFSEIYQQKRGEGLLAWLLRAWDSGTASIRILTSEKKL